MRIVNAIFVVLLVHLVLTILVHPYSTRMMTVGGWITHGNDIADALRLVTVGFLVSGGVLAAVTAIIVRFAWTNRPGPEQE